MASRYIMLPAPHPILHMDLRLQLLIAWGITQFLSVIKYSYLDNIWMKMFLWFSVMMKLSHWYPEKENMPGYTGLWKLQKLPELNILVPTNAAQNNKEFAAKAHFLNSKMQLWFTQCSLLGFMLFRAMARDTLLAKVTFHSSFPGFFREADVPL